MYTIYHNPRCSKSRNGLAYLTEKKVDFKVREYLKDLLSEAELSALVMKLHVKPVELTAVMEAGIAAIFAHLWAEVLCELDEAMNDAGRNEQGVTRCERDTLIAEQELATARVDDIDLILFVGFLVVLPQWLVIAEF